MRGALLRLAFVALADLVALPAFAQRPEDVTICVTNRVPAPMPPCGTAAAGTWSISGSFAGGGSELEGCTHFNAHGLVADVDVELIGEPGDSISLNSHNLVDWQSVAQCEVPEPNPCGLSCENLYNARSGRWRVTGGTGKWANLQGEGTDTTLFTKEYDGEGLCPNQTNAECSSNLCDAAVRKCFRRIAHVYLSGRAHILKKP
jgi:hypothetical protein